MVKMILCGCRGHMGRVITELAGSYANRGFEARRIV